MENTSHIADLIVKKIRERISDEELRELDLWRGESPENEQIFRRASDPGEQLSKMQVYRLFDKEKVWSSLEDELFQKKTRFLNPRRVLRYAASILLPLLLLGAGAIYFLNRDSEFTLADLDGEIQPGSNKAVLILSDGRSLELTQESGTQNIEEGSAQIINQDQVVSYSGGDAIAEEEILYNELKTPRGGSYQLKLADGTAIWLNAGSSLRFPVTFSGNSREVFLVGEAFFDVSHTGQSFIVHSPEMDLRVLGTTFNISAYADGSEYKTTLVDGSVQVDFQVGNSEGSVSKILLPNDQAVWDRSTSNITVNEVNPSYYTSWIHGKIEFDNEDLDMVMKRLSRWYDFSYSFENPNAKAFHFSARLDRDEHISSILEMLEMTTDVKFEYIEGNIIIH